MVIAKGLSQSNNINPISFLFFFLTHKTGVANRNNIIIMKSSKKQYKSSS